MRGVFSALLISFFSLSSSCAIAAHNEQYEFTVAKILASTEGQLPHRVRVAVSVSWSGYGFILKDPGCADPCENVLRLRIPERIETRRDVAKLISDIGNSESFVGVRLDGVVLEVMPIYTSHLVGPGSKLRRRMVSELELSSVISGGFSASGARQ